MTTMNKLLPFLLLLTVASASIHLVTPVNVNIDPLGEVKVSPVGPGHQVFLKFQKETEEKIFWDSLRIINQIDADWQTTTYSDHMYIYYLIDVPKNKPSGEYTFEFLVTDNEALMESEIAVVKVFVTHDQNDLVQVIPFEKDFEFFASTQNNAYFKIRNKALSRAKYQVTSRITNFPAYGSKTIEHQLEAGETKSIPVPFEVPEQGEYNLAVHVWSSDNPTISRDTQATVWVKPTLSSKLKSIGRGFPIIPLTMAPFYALLGLFGI